MIVCKEFDMAKSVVIVGIDCKYIDKLAKQVAETVDRMFLSMKDLIVYEMQGMIGNIEHLDSEYINAKVSEVKLRALDYEDSIISIDVTNLGDKALLDGMSEMLKIYAVSESCDSDFAIVCDDRDKYLRSIANFVVEKGEEKWQVEKIVDLICNHQ